MLASRPDLADQAVDEVIRWCPAAPIVYRFAAQDFDFHDLRVDEDMFLTMCVVAAQRDPRVFPDGATFDITTPQAAPALQFGAGPHHCLGSALAKAEIGEALRLLTARLGPPVVDGPLSWRPPMGFHGPNALPLRFSENLGQELRETR